MLTPRGVALLAGAVLAWVTGRILGVSEFSVVALTAVALVAIGAVVTLLSGSTVAVRRRVSAPRIRAGGTSQVRIELRNEGRLPVPLLLVRDQSDPGLHDEDETPRFVIPGLPRGAAARVGWTVRGNVRGRYVVGPVHIALRDPFGTTQRVRRYRTTDEVVVYPRVDPLPPGVGWGTQRGSGTSDTRRLFNAGDEFYMMREYVLGDDLRHVHWPSTAHRQKLMVRQHELPWHAQAVVFCDTRAEMHDGTGPTASVERALSAAASVVWHLEEHRYQVRFVTETDVRIPAPASRDALMDRLAVLRPSRRQVLPPVLRALRDVGGDGLLVAVLTPPEGELGTGDRDIRALLQAGQGFSGRIALVIEPGRRGQPRADRFAALLRGAGWRAAVVGSDGDTADAWRRILSTQAQPAVSTAHRPDTTTAGRT